MSALFQRSQNQIQNGAKNYENASRAKSKLNTKRSGEL